MSNAGATAEQPETAAPPNPPPMLSKNLISVSLISTVLLFSVLLIKIYGVAHYNVNIVVALASSSPTAVLLGTIGLYSYIFAAVIAVAACCLFAASFTNSRLAPFRLLLFIGVLFLAILTPWPYLVDATILIGVLTFLQWIGAKLPVIGQNSGFHFIKACITSVIATIMLFTLITLDRPWLPAEIVTLRHKIVTNQVEPIKSKSQQPVAFVLGEETGRVELLIDDDRNIVYVPTGEVVKREICNLNNNPMGSVPLFESLTGHHFKPHVKSCWRLTDQPTEHMNMNAPLPIRLLEWCPRKPYPHPAGKPPGCF